MARPWQRVALLALAALLGGCSTVMLVDNQVQSFAAWDDARAPAPGQVFRFERLPSQGAPAQAAALDLLEAPVRRVLAQWGLKPADAGEAVRWTVQVSAQVRRLPRAPWEQPMYPFDFGGQGHVVTRDGRVVFMPSLAMRMELPYYEREFSVLLRDATNGRVVYETRAAHDGRWHDSAALWGAMAEAALRDFPRPPAGLRRVDIEIPR